MDLFQMRQLIAIEKYGSISKAAENLYISPQAISASLKNIESECGKQLFERYKKRLILNDFGRSILPFIHQVIDDDNKLNEFIALSKDKKNTTIRVDTVTHGLLRFFVTEYSIFRPDFIVISNCIINDEKRVVDRLKTTEADICVSYIPYEIEGFFCIQLFKRIPMIAVPKDSNLNNHPSISIDELHDYQVIYHSEYELTNDPLHQLVNTNKLKCERINDLYLFQKKLEQGDCCALVTTISKCAINHIIYDKYAFIPLKDLYNPTNYEKFSNNVYVIGRKELESEFITFQEIIKQKMQV